MEDPPLLTIPERIRSIPDVLAISGKLDLSQIVVLGYSKTGGLVLLSSGEDDQLTGAQVLWMIESGRNLLFSDAAYEKT